ncbi:MAG: peptide chain release factor N(5)-glutamine methyltransferase [Burkholderiaceae bacterium]
MDYARPGGTIAPGVSIAQLLRIAPYSAVESRLLVAHALRLSRTQLITQSDHVLDAEEARRVQEAFARRGAGEPIAYIVGSREFYGLSMLVTPAVLIPRADTELLVDLALARAEAGARILDLGTGSGAIAIAIACNRPDVQMSATDISEEALDVARENAALHRARVSFRRSHWFAELKELTFNLIISNPPYIVAGDAHLTQGDLPFEPLNALTDHADGLCALRLLAAGAAAHLRPGGWLLLEHGHDQAQAVRRLICAGGFDAVQSWTDLAGIERVSGGRLASPAEKPSDSLCIPATSSRRF